MSESVQIYTAASTQRMGTSIAIAEGATWALGSMTFYKFSINLVPYYAEEAVNYETTLIYWDKEYTILTVNLLQK
jgi:hypothetical protein